MSLLTDHDLIENLTAKPPIEAYVEGLEGLKAPADPYSSQSPVQASSVDLHIGNVYIPGKEEHENGGAENPMLDYELETGETAVVTTKEKLHLPSNIAGFGFPPSGVSFKGLLMTNPGHVDPGYDGVMRFTVINMGKADYRLTRGDRIVTLLLFKMNTPAHSSWRERHPEGSSLPNKSQINRLSKDFVDVEERATRIARAEGAKISSYIAGSLTVLTVFLGLVGSGHLLRNAELDDLKKRQETVEYDLKNRVNVEQKLLDFDKRLTDIERGQPKNSVKTETKTETKTSGNSQ